MKRRLLTVLLVMAIMLCVGTIAYAATYSLNKTVPATITINNPPPPPPPPPPEAAELYTDSDCTIQFSGTLDFGTVLTTGSPVTQTLYYRTAEITQATISVISVIDTAKATFEYTVGDGFVDFTVTPVASGTVNFNITVTGTT